MDKGQVFAESFIAHYKHYDPVKAKEYYERTKELKGRKPAVKDLGKSEDKKAAWAYTKNQLSEAKKGESTSISESRKQKLEEVRARLAERREQISKKLTDTLKQLSEVNKETNAELTMDRKLEAKRISDEAKAKIDAIPALPNGLSKERRAELSAERSAKIAKIRGEAEGERKKLDESVTRQRNESRFYTGVAKGENRKAADADREKVTTELKATVEKSRQEFMALKEQLKAKYEQKALDEFEGIKTMPTKRKGAK